MFIAAQKFAARDFSRSLRFNFRGTGPIFPPRSRARVFDIYRSRIHGEIHDGRFLAGKSSEAVALPRLRKFRSGHDAFFGSKAAAALLAGKRCAIIINIRVNTVYRVSRNHRCFPSSRDNGSRDKKKKKKLAELSL